MASGTLSATSQWHVSVSPATMNNLLDLVTDPIQPAHHCYQPVQSDRPFACTAKISPVSTFLSMIRQFHEHNWHISWAVQHSIIIKTLSTIGSALFVALNSTSKHCQTNIGSLWNTDIYLHAAVIPTVSASTVYMLRNYTKCEVLDEFLCVFSFASKNNFYFYLTCTCPAIVLQLCRGTEIGMP